MHNYTYHVSYIMLTQAASPKVLLLVLDILISIYIILNGAVAG